MFTLKPSLIERVTARFEGDLVRVTHHRLHPDGRDIGGEAWFERAHANWVIEMLSACLAVYAFPKAELEGGLDHLSIFESGPEQEPVINLFNVRPEGAAHAGIYARSLSRPAAARLLELLSTLA